MNFAKRENFHFFGLEKMKDENPFSTSTKHVIMPSPVIKLVDKTENDTGKV